jgi:hypothetical protein
MKICAKCNIDKPFDQFCSNKNRKDGYHYYCRECHAKSNKRWRDDNLDIALATSKRYRDANKKSCQAASKAWAKANPEKVKAWRAKYNQENTGYLQDKDARYKASKQNRTPKWLTEYDLLAIRCKYSVAAMLNKHGIEKWDVDHIIPLNGKTVSGLHVPWNLQVITAKQNKIKGNRN